MRKQCSNVRRVVSAFTRCDIEAVADRSDIGTEMKAQWGGVGCAKECPGIGRESISWRTNNTDQLETVTLLMRTDGKPGWTSEGSLAKTYKSHAWCECDHTRQRRGLEIRRTVVWYRHCRHTTGNHNTPQIQSGSRTTKIETSEMTRQSSATDVHTAQC